MKFNEESKVIIDTMNQNEARAFIRFLETEIARHKRDIENAVELIYTVCDKFDLWNMIDS